MPPIDLKGLRVLVTRPTVLAGGLCQEITTHGGQAIHFPVIEFTEPSNRISFEGALLQLHSITWVVFISIPAVRSVVATLTRLQLKWPPTARIAVIGHGSAAACRTNGLEPALIPKMQQDSEGLIESFSGCDLVDKKVILFRGQSGRETLQNFFIRQGAQFSAVECYRRQTVCCSGEPIESRLRMQGLDAIVVSSQSTVDALLQLVDEIHHPDLLQIPMVTVSKRVADYCNKKGVLGRVKIASSTCAKDIVAALYTV